MNFNFLRTNICLVAFWHILLICSAHLPLLDMVTPKCLWLSTWFKFSELNLRFIGFMFYRNKITIYSVFWRLRDRPFNLKCGVMVFCFVQNFFLDNTRVRIFIFFVPQSANFFSEFNISLYDKNSESDFFFSSTKIRMFFWATLGIRLFF